MSDPTTELSREFLEFNNYIVKKETKFYKNPELKGTPGDIDILAVSSSDTKFREFKLNKNIVAEVKNWPVMTKKSFKEIYDDKFKFINNEKIGWKQLKHYISEKNFDRILFCFGTTREVYEYALYDYKVRIITTGFIIKKFCEIYSNDFSDTYYPEAYQFSLIRSVMKYLYDSHRFKDKLLLKDLVAIDPENEPRYCNHFNNRNSEFMADFLYFDNDRLIELMKKEPEWFYKESGKLITKNK